MRWIIALIALSLSLVACTPKQKKIDYCKANGMDKSLILKRQAAIISALKSHDKASLISSMKFPLRINAGTGKNFKHLCFTKANFSDNFDTVFSKTVTAKMIKNLSSNGNDPICRYDGAGLGNGALWLTPDKNNFIYSINLINLPKISVNSAIPCKGILPH